MRKISTRKKNNKIIYCQDLRASIGVRPFSVRKSAQTHNKTRTRRKKPEPEL